MSSIWPLVVTARVRQVRGMNVLWIFAHPEQESLNGALRRDGLRVLRSLGHQVRMSDLYAMGWKATVDGDDFPDAAPEQRLVVPSASKRAFRSGSLSPDILAELDKLRWADAVVFQFPLWWYGMPAILKGWFDRVFVKGFAYGVPDPSRPGRSLRYGEGNLQGKRALVLVTTGSPRPAMGPRGVNGELEQVLFPLLHGTLWYVGMSVLPPVAVYGADRLGPEEYDDVAHDLRTRLARLEETPPLPYRCQNGGDYDDRLVLRPEHEPGASGLAVHYRREPDERQNLAPQCAEGAGAAGITPLPR
jgi:NAD(P)H dehydrogenase (quinone)